MALPHPSPPTTPPSSPRRAVFLDRDDTLIHCRSVTPDGDLGDPELVRLTDGAAEACAALTKAGYALIVVSNQGGVARGRYTEREVGAVNARVNELLGGVIERFYYCPFHPRGIVPAYTREHPWRKPAPGMPLAAAQAMDLDLARSWMIGDAERDIEAGHGAGCRAVRIGGAGVESSAECVAPDLAHAARIILREPDRS
ncbi:MAG: HAD family hydrolase [Phycisphaeraceae bacterium]|nr:HAD family hydrolase [Phycisphaeraceae bacterium]